MWGIKKWCCLVLSTWAAMFSLRAFKEAKQLIDGFDQKDVQKLNKIQQTGVFEFPDAKEKEPDELWF